MTATAVPNLTVSQVAKLIDHSLLQPQMTRADIDEGCDIAAEHVTATVCVRGYDTAYCARRLDGTGVGVSVVTGFPHGNGTIAAKVAETEDAVANGATEIDVVVAIGLVRSGLWRHVAQEIEQVNNACQGRPLKVIFENAYLEPAQIQQLAEICTDLGVAFVKTSTGYAPTGAMLADLRLMRQHAGPAVQIKAAGGIRTLDQLVEMHQAGVTRFGTRSTAEIIAQAIERGWPAA